ncbi:ATP phosphoribosyltransferase [Puniceicoccales bacterium CK1056]|uniref:ATP phosphoribosyltransferase n=1 Tax=Oceanipulchritudo coccoides TaxID=2706888 RepID=A0A6B2M0W2_9BACT|nr:ATP phosphoribosyltransferase [Oceanipulchritudo coccoides]NDV62353.1 ATP phosphoribosyltransferase [Oceanipulchritudo coccoides]
MFKVAIPNKGSLSEGAVEILSDAGYRCKRHSRELVVRDAEHDVEFIFLRPRDIAVYVGSGLVNAGITGRDLAQDSEAAVEECLSLNLGRSRFCYAVPKGSGITPDTLGGKRIATSYASIVRQDLKKRGIEAQVVRLDGAVEISIKLGVADVIADVVESGRTLVEAGLEITGDPIMKSEAVVIHRKGNSPDEALNLLLKRLEGILVAREYVLLEYVVPRNSIDAACAITPGVKSPTVSPVNEAGWVAVAAMVKAAGLNRIIDQLGELQAKGIIAQEIKTCRL